MRSPDLGTESPVVARPRRGGWFWALFPLTGFALFGVVVWLAYRDVTRGPPVGEPPLVKAAADPIKLPPEQAADPSGEEGGAVGRLWSDTEQADQPERLLPLPEEPLSPQAVASPDVSAASPAEVTVPGPPSSVEMPTAERETSVVTAPADAPAATSGEQGGVTEAEAALDRLLAEVTALSDEPATASDETLTPTAAEEAGSPPSEDARAALEAPPPSATSGRSPPGEPVSASDAESEASGAGASDTAAASAEVRPDRALETPTAVAEPAAPTAEGAGLSTATTPPPATRVAAIEDRFRIQVAAVRAEADARRAWSRFEQDLGPMLGDVQPFFERAETANGVFYRVQIGPFATQQRAESLCAELKQHNASCFVIRR